MARYSVMTSSPSSSTSPDSEGGSPPRPRPRPRLGVFKLASCDGCQLTLLDCEDELLELAAAVEIVHFAELSSQLAPRGPFDLVLVEGSVSTPEQALMIRDIRASTRRLVTLGACATAGGIQSLRNFADHREYLRIVYATPDYIETLSTATPVSHHVPVDFELRGCPIDRHQLLEVISAFLVGRKPNIADEAVCMECKRRQVVCVTVARGEPCLGPVTHAGCGALCPAFSRGCYGCFGAREQPNTVAVASLMRSLGRGDREVAHAFALFTASDEAFAAERKRHDGQPG